MRRLGSLFCGLACVASSLAWGQEVMREGRTTTTPAGAPATRHMVSQIIGSSVRLQDGSPSGRVEDIVLNEDGRAEYIVISREGKSVMLPWSVAHVDYGRRVVTFDVLPQVVQPYFSSGGARPNETEPAYRQRARGAFGPRATDREMRQVVTPGVQPGAAAPLIVPTPPGMLPPEQGRLGRPQDINSSPLSVVPTPGVPGPGIPGPGGGPPVGMPGPTVPEAVPPPGSPAPAPAGEAAVPPGPAGPAELP